MKLNFSTLAAAAIALSSTFGGLAVASPILVDRGLPTANLNNAAGVNRSNVAWALNPPAGSVPGNWVVGDSFTNSSSQTWNIDRISMWTILNPTTTQLWGGLGGGAISSLAAGVISSPVFYADASTYQGTSGTFREMRQLDFAVNIMLAAGATYEFYLDGTGSGFTVNGNPFAHASNAALSGSTQDGSDNLMLGGQIVGGAFDTTTRFSWTSQAPGVWDKTSDLNVQVFGNAVPEPTTFALAGLALAGLVIARRRRA